jgi:tetratricopeptide (TPR) repeat protein
MVENHSQALAQWAEKDIRDAVLINFDTHDDLRWIPDEKIDALSQIYRKKDWRSFRAVDTSADDGLYHLGNWIYAGGRLGIFREVYWVIPFDIFSMYNPDAMLRRFLRDYEYNDEEIQTFTLRDRRFHGTFHGVPLTICDIRSLPEISSPLLLSLDTDFFPPYSTEHEKSYLPSLHDVFHELYKKKYRILDAVVAYSVNGDYLPPHLRWVGDTIGMILEKPGLIEEQPPEFLTLLQQIDNHYRDTDTIQMLKLIESWQERYPIAALQSYKALAHKMRNAPEDAYRAAIESSRLDQRYSTLLPYIGIYFYRAGQYHEAEKFYRAGFAANPNMANGLFQYAHCLRQMGRMKEAIAWYEKQESRDGLFPSRFLIAEMQLLLRDRQAASTSIAKAAEGLFKNRYAVVINDETARAIYAALDFCDREGLVQLSGALRSNPAIVNMFASYPRT